MSEQLWTEVDTYFTDRLSLADEALAGALAASDEAGLPAINVSANQGKLLQLLAEIQGARRILEIGTLGGYSTIWLARALPSDGSLITLEYAPEHAAVARANLDRAGFAENVDIRVGPALDSLARLAAEGTEPFDFVFIDADKVNNANYLNWVLDHTRPGSVVVVDNVVRSGAVKDAGSTDPSVVGTRAALDLLAAEPRLSGTAVQTVGSKGYDGFALARVLA